MAWNKTEKILGSTCTAEVEADVIFTAVFLGLVAEYGTKPGKKWRVTMEPEMEWPSDTCKRLSRSQRTDKDQVNMNNLNELCLRVNHVVRSYLKDDEVRLTWGFVPTFTAGGMIAGGAEAKLLDNKLKPEAKEFLRKYLTGISRKTDRAETGDMYIGRGAYCGLILDDEGDAVDALSTVRTSLKENGANLPPALAAQVGTRWAPKVRNGAIGTSADEATTKSLGMKYFFDAPSSGAEILGYTHGLPRAVYECVRAGHGHPYEMSIGQNTFKLASCMGCTFFMVANGFEPSASHMGKAESWSPLYHTRAEIPIPLAPEDPNHDSVQMTAKANDLWANKIKTWMLMGVSIMELGKTGAWFDQSRTSALDKLKDKSANPDTLTCGNLLLDAFTVHKHDVQRVLDTIPYGLNPRTGCTPGSSFWDSSIVDYVSPYTDEQLKDLADPSKLEIPKKA